MQELEKILEEIEMKKKKCLDIVRVEIDPMEITIHREQYKGLRMAEDIIRKHMNDGWIPMEKFGLPKSNEHDFMFWITIQYVNGFRRTIKAKWDWFDKCFMHQNGKKISEDVVAYKYYSAPEPYHPERSDNHDGESSFN